MKTRHVNNGNNFAVSLNASASGDLYRNIAKSFRCKFNYNIIDYRFLNLLAMPTLLKLFQLSISPKKASVWHGFNNAGQWNARINVVKSMECKSGFYLNE